MCIFAHIEFSETIGVAIQYVQLCIFAHIESREQIVVTTKTLQQYILVNTERSEFIIITVQYAQLRIFTQIERRESISTAVQESQFRIIFQVELCKLVVITVEILQLSVIAHIEHSKRVIGTVQCTQLRIFAHIERRDRVVVAIDVRKWYVVACIECGYISLILVAVYSTHITIYRHSSVTGYIIHRSYPVDTYGYGLVGCTAHYLHRCVFFVRRKIDFYFCSFLYGKRYVTLHIDTATAATLFSAGKALNVGKILKIQDLPIFGSSIAAVGSKYYIFVGRRSIM